MPAFCSTSPGSHPKARASKLDGVLGAGRLRLTAEGLDNLAVIVERAIGTANLAMSLSLPAYSFNLRSGLAYRNLETRRRIVEAQATGRPGGGLNALPKKQNPAGGPGSDPAHPLRSPPTVPSDGTTTGKASERSPR